MAAAGKLDLGDLESDDDASEAELRMEMMRQLKRRYEDLRDATEKGTQESMEVAVEVVRSKRAAR